MFGKVSFFRSLNSSFKYALLFLVASAALVAVTPLYVL